MGQARARTRVCAGTATCLAKRQVLADLLTCQTEYQTEDDEKLEEDRQPLEAVKLPAAADSRESRCSGPSRGGVMAATLL